MVSVGEAGKDGRLGQLLLIFSKIGDVGSIEAGGKSLAVRMITLSIKSALWSFLYSFRKVKAPDVILIDNYTSAFLFFIFKYLNPKIIYVYDMRELYIDNPEYKLLTRALIWFERMCLRRCDLLIVANQYREKFCRRYFKVDRRKIITVDNIRYLPPVGNPKVINEKSRVNVVSTGGYNRSRLSRRLVEEFRNLDQDEFCLYFVGGGLDEFIQDFGVLPENIFILGRMDLKDFTKFIPTMDIGIVDYTSENLNNRYCASGKITEFMAVGIPIVCSENIPLKRFCDQYRVGVATRRFDLGIQEVADGYERFASNCHQKDLVDSLSSYNCRVSEEIKKRICFV